MRYIILWFSSRTTQGMMGGLSLGVACGHIKEVSVLKACRADMPGVLGRTHGNNLMHMFKHHLVECDW